MATLGHYHVATTSAQFLSYLSAVTDYNPSSQSL